MRNFWKRQKKVCVRFISSVASCAVTRDCSLLLPASISRLFFGSSVFAINSSQKWDKDIHKNGGVNINDRCVNWFSKFITKDENLRPDQEICKIYNLNSQKATIKLYKTKENNAKFIDEKDNKGEPIVHKFAEYMIDVGDKYDKSCREVEVKMKLGGTFISSSAIYKKTKDEAKITCLYE